MQRFAYKYFTLDSLKCADFPVLQRCNLLFILKFILKKNYVFKITKVHKKITKVTSFK